MGQIWQIPACYAKCSKPIEMFAVVWTVALPCWREA